MSGALEWWPAPAKLNLFLHLTGRRPDGYHDLQTIFQIIDFCDFLSFESSSDGRVARVDDENDDATTAALAGVPSDADLTVRAALALQQFAGHRAGVHIRIRKRIPLGGGLGGGSSDAATTLCVLNRLWGLDIPVAELARLGLALGADVPVFVQGQTAWGEGLGERLTPLATPARWFVVLHPGVAVPTREIFQAPELTRNSPVITIPALLPSGGRNDCEPVVRRRFPEVAAALDWLALASPSRLTGTGACVFASFASSDAAARVAASVPARWSAFVARGLERSPLMEQLA
jgi:4-diphosphocytidyl-2-C-methyl-D-erythritol kinase